MGKHQSKYEKVHSLFKQPTKQFKQPQKLEQCNTYQSDQLPEKPVPCCIIVVKKSEYEDKLRPHLTKKHRYPIKSLGPRSDNTDDWYVRINFCSSSGDTNNNGEHSQWQLIYCYRLWQCRHILAPTVWTQQRLKAFTFDNMFAIPAKRCHDRGRIGGLSRECSKTKVRWFLVDR